MRGVSVWLSSALVVRSTEGQSGASSASTDGKEVPFTPHFRHAKAAQCLVHGRLGFWASGLLGCSGTQRHDTGMDSLQRGSLSIPGGWNPRHAASTTPLWAPELSLNAIRRSDFSPRGLPNAVSLPEVRMRFVSHPQSSWEQRETVQRLTGGLVG